MRKAEVPDMYHRLRSAAADARHDKIKEPSVTTIVKKKKKQKEICKALTAAMPAGTTTLDFCKIPFYLVLKMKFYVGTGLL